jgi:hypothetical protein
MSEVIVFDPQTCTSCGRMTAPSAFAPVSPSSTQRRSECRAFEAGRSVEFGADHDR